MTRPKLLPLLALFVALLLSAGRTSALPGDLSTKFPVNDDNPTANIPSQDDRAENPLEFGYFLQDLIARAEGAFLKKDWANAVKYYEALAKTVPDRAISFSRLCVAYAELGKVDQAAASCEHAISRGGAQVMDHFRFITLSLQKKKLDPSYVAALDASIAHVRAFVATNAAEPEASASSAPSALAAPSTSPSARTPAAASNAPSPRPALSAFAATHQAAVEEAERRKQAASKGAPAEQQPVNLALDIEVLACKLAVRLKDAKRLAACVQALQGVHADEKVILPFEWSAALVAKDQPKASAILQRAEAMQYPAPALAAMRTEQQKIFKSSLIPNGLRHGGTAWLFGFLLVLLVAAGVLWRTLASQKRRKLGPENPA
jgi:hypothetical protein